MKKNYIDQLLEDPGIQKLLKEMILEKDNRFTVLNAEKLSDEEVDNLLKDNINETTLKKIFLNAEIEEELTLTERDLSSLCFHLNKARKRISKSTNWENAYQFATKMVEIANVVSHFVGTSNLNRNIKCPFHEDGSPSFKVYAKSNRFVCFGCGARGSPIDFVIKYKNCSFKEAVLYLNQF